ncbi:MAG: DNA translocase FtsK [Fuerstiella sp.]|nr:DNA translocase FtsK [Fuerstiella sp.]
MFDFERFRNDTLALGLLALVVFVGLSFLSYDPADPPSDLVFPARRSPVNICGSLGASIAFYGRHLLGFGVWVAMAAVVAWDMRLLSRDKTRGNLLSLAGTVILVISGCVAVQLAAPTFDSGSTWGSGGMTGALGGTLLTHFCAPTGVIIVLICGLVSGWMLSPLWHLTNPGLKLAAAPVAIASMASSLLRSQTARRSSIHETNNHPDQNISPLADIDNVIEDEESSWDNEPLDPEDEDEESAGLRINPPVALTVHQTAEPRMQREYQLPEIELLDPPEDFDYEQLAKKARLAAATLESTFQQFGLNIKVSEVDTGPVITQFELELEPGLRLSKVTALEDDLAIALRVPSVRVVAPIPGKNTVGVEVPNENQVTVRLQELLMTAGSEIDKFKIPLLVGKDVSGHPMVVDLAKMPHLLIAGRTGTGKSVCLNSLILSILMTRTPDEVKMLMIDPKMVELSPYKNLPHLMHPVITDMKKAEAVLAWAVEKMEERYDLLARIGVRHLDGFNKLSRGKILDRLGISELHEEAENIPHKMPYIVIVADEMADLMMTSGKDVEAHIIRLAQKSRAVGIHLVLATQKPTVDVITGLIKSNLPARISFQVASKMDSRVVLDEGGAERLLGCGDMLYLAPGTSSVSRAQGTFVSDDEITDVIDFFSDLEPDYSEELQQIVAGSSTSGGSGDNAPRQADDLYENAIDVVVREGRGSVSLLQRCLGIGYGRAARMIDWMAEDGVVGEYNGAQAREVIYSPEQWEAVKASRES